MIIFLPYQLFFLSVETKFKILFQIATEGSDHDYYHDYLGQ